MPPLVSWSTLSSATEGLRQSLCPGYEGGCSGSGACGLLPLSVLEGQVSLSDASSCLGAPRLPRSPLVRLLQDWPPRPWLPHGARIDGVASSTSCQLCQLKKCSQGAMASTCSRFSESSTYRERKARTCLAVLATRSLATARVPTMSQLPLSSRQMASHPEQP